MGCSLCPERAVTLIRYSGQHLCRDHFLASVERRAKREIRTQADLKDGARLALALSGGKDSTVAAVLVHELLGHRPDVDVVAVTVDEGIRAYRPGGVAAAKALCDRLGIPHRVVRYEDLYGRGMDEVVALDADAIPCGYCGPFRRHALNRAAKEAKADYVVTGLNLDDTAQSILMNFVRGDLAKMARLGPHDRVQEGLVPRLQPLRRVPEKEVYLYAFLRGLPFHDATCPYADRAQRVRFRRMLEGLEAASPGTRHAILKGYDALRPALEAIRPPAALRSCPLCGEPTANALCRACVLQEALEAA